MQVHSEMQEENGLPRTNI